MNYGIFVLGATIKISLFLRMCNSVVLPPTSTSSSSFNHVQSYPLPLAYAKENIPEDLEDQNHFKDLMGNYNHSIWNWLIGRRNFVIEHYVKKTIGEEKLSNYILDQMEFETHGIGSGNSWIRSDSDSGDIISSSTQNPTPGIELRICSSKFVPKKGIEAEENEDSLGISPTLSPSAPEGCYFIDNDGEFPKYLTCDNITNIPSPLPSDLDLFELNSTQIQIIPKNSFSDNSISVLRLNNNPNLALIAPNAFQGINNTKLIEIRSSPELTWIWFEDAFIGLNKTMILSIEFNGINLESVGEFCIEKENIEDIQPVLPRLITLSLRQNPLGIIPRTFFAPLRESILSLLVLRNCALRDIHPEALAFLPKLKQLDLSENPNLMINLESVLQGLRNSSLTAINLATNVLSEIPKTALTHIGHSLQELDIRGNSLFQLTKDSFPTNMNGMKSINFENCKLFAVDEGVFDNMPELEILMFKDNSLQVVPPPIHKLHNLNVLDLSYNFLRDTTRPPFTFKIPSNSFANLKKLKILILSNTLLNEVKVDYFRGLIKLNMLLLENTGLNSIQDFSFSELTKLEVLHLKSNTKLTGINSNTFSGLGSLKTLYLNSTGLVYPPKIKTEDTLAIFKYTPNLEYIYITDNQISSLKPELFEGLEKLHYLDLSQNRVSSWDNEIFSTNIVLQELRLNQNNIKIITSPMMEDFHDKRNTSWYYKIIDLSLNPFNCDLGTCHLKSGNENGEFQLKFWDAEGYYSCDMDPGLEVPIQDLTNEFCDSFITTTGNTEMFETTTEMFDSGKASEVKSKLSSTAKVAIGLGSTTFAVLLLGLLIYKNQQKFSYPWFLFKLHSSKLIGRNPKSSELISECSSSGSFYEFDVFVSYSHFDQNFIQENLIPELENEHGKSANGQKFRVCLHERDFEVGAPITENIIDSVDRSRTIIIVMSEKYLESEWCLFEMNLAYHRLVELRRDTSSFLLIFLKDVPGKKRPKVLNYLMKSRTYLKWPQENGTEEEIKIFWKRLKSALLCNNLPQSDNDSNC